MILEAICDPDTYIWYSFFGEPGSMNDLNILKKSTTVGSILNGTMELHLPQELHYSINGTVQDYLYFLVDGIYPKWPIFISTVSNAIPGSKDKMFATHQEVVRKDIEQAFGQIVKNFDILSRPFLASTHRDCFLGKFGTEHVPVWTDSLSWPAVN